MSRHIHLLCKTTNSFILTNLMRDFKKFTSKKIIELINNESQCRQEWLLDYFKKASEHLKNSNTKVWQNGYHAEYIFSNKFIKQKVEYIHNNPVKDKIVAFPEDYYYSSIRSC